MLSNWVRFILQATMYDTAIQTPLEPAKKLSSQSVLVGIQMGGHTVADLLEGMGSIGYACEVMTDNLGYQMFLK